MNGGLPHLDGLTPIACEVDVLVNIAFVEREIWLVRQNIEGVVVDAKNGLGAVDAGSRTRFAR